MKTGCPLIGVCFPSFLGSGGAKRVVMKSVAWDRMVLIPLSRMYGRSLSVNLKRDRNKVRSKITQEIIRKYVEQPKFGQFRRFLAVKL